MGRREDWHWPDDMLGSRNSAVAYISWNTEPGAYVIADEQDGGYVLTEHTTPDAALAHLLRLRLDGYAIPAGDVHWLRRRIAEREGRHAQQTTP